MLTRLRARAQEEKERARAQEERERVTWDVFSQPELLRKIVEYPSAGSMRLVCKQLRDTLDSTVTKLKWRVVSYCSTYGAQSCLLIDASLTLFGTFRMLCRQQSQQM